MYRNEMFTMQERFDISPRIVIALGLGLTLFGIKTFFRVLLPQTPLISFLELVSVGVLFSFLLK
jgi:hypothetical protein